MDANDRAETCLQHAAIQDNLLQNYRNFLITLESVLLAVGVVLLSSILSGGTFQLVVGAVALTLLAVFSVWIIRRGRGIVTARGEDVSYWHRRTLEQEQQLSARNRLFTDFKLHQKRHRQDDDEEFRRIFEDADKDDGLTDEQVKTVVEKGKSHTRETLDTLIPAALMLAWVLLILIAAIAVILEVSGMGIVLP